MKPHYYVYAPRMNYMTKKLDYAWIILPKEKYVWDFDTKGFMWVHATEFPRGIPDEAWNCGFHNAADNIDRGLIDEWEA